MAKRWYLIPKSSVMKEPEIGNYEVSGNLTDFPRGIYLAYANKGLVCGFKKRKEAEAWRDHGVYDEKTDTWTKLPEREPA